MKQIILPVFFLFISFNLQAQTKTADTTGAAAALTTTAQKMMQLFIDKNYTAYINFVHPKIITSLGGKVNMISIIKKSITDMEQQGYTFKDVTIGAASPIIISKTELQAVVTQLLELKTADGKLLSTSYLIATSNNRGKSWYFSDTSGKNLKQMKAFFPSLSDKLVIPEKKEPVYYKD